MAGSDNSGAGGASGGQPAPMAVTLGGAAPQRRAGASGDTEMSSGADPLAAAARNDGPRASQVVG